MNLCVYRLTRKFFFPAPAGTSSAATRHFSFALFGKLIMFFKRQKSQCCQQQRKKRNATKTSYIIAAAGRWETLLASVSGQTDRLPFSCIQTHTRLNACWGYVIWLICWAAEIKTLLFMRFYADIFAFIWMFLYFSSQCFKIQQCWNI